MIKKRKNAPSYRDPDYFCDFEILHWKSISGAQSLQGVLKPKVLLNSAVWDVSGPNGQLIALESRRAAVQGVAKKNR